MHKYHKCCSELIWLFYSLLQQLWGKTSIISYLRDFSAQVSQIVFSAHFNRFPASYNCMSENFKSLISPWAKCTSATNRVLSSFDRFTAYYKCMRKNFKNLMSPWVQCTSITKSCSQIIWPSHGLFQLYEIKLKKSHNFVSSVHKYHKSFSQLPWPIYGFLQLYEVKLQKSHISVSSLHKYDKSCSELIWPFYGL